jgi:hypothetical protein
MITALILASATNVSRAKDSHSALPLARPDSGTQAAGQRSELDLLPVMPAKKIRETIVAGAQRLKAGLAPLKEGATWGDYLKLGVLPNLAGDESRTPLDAVGRRQIQGILLIYDNIAQNKKFLGITTLDGFHIIHSSLVALINPTYANDRDRLIQSTYLLAQTATELGMGTSWKQMLAMPKNLVTPDLLTGKNLPRAIVQLQHMQKRFEIVAEDPSFEMVAEIPIFQITRANLDKYLNRLVRIAAISD